VLPNFFIVGAIKAGTTSLHSYAALHPEISMSFPKELHVFSKDDWRQRLALYEGQFDPSRPVRGESTPHYAWHPHRRDVPRRIVSLVPDARLVYLVRDPIDRIVSHWIERYANGERGRSLKEYVDDCANPTNPLVSASRYHTQVQRYREVFPPEQMLIIDQDKLRRERLATLRRVFAFLGVDPDFEAPAFDRNENTRTDKRALTSFGLPLWNRVLGPAVKRLPEPAQRPVRRRLVRALSRPIPDPPPLTERERSKLVAVLQDEVDALREDTGEQFASWSL
jgi:hypothetical protein